MTTPLNVTPFGHLTIPLICQALAVLTTRMNARELTINLNTDFMISSVMLWLIVDFLGLASCGFPGQPRRSSRSFTRVAGGKGATPRTNGLARKRSWWKQDIPYPLL